MKKITIAIFWISAIMSSANAAAQVGIGTTTPEGAFEIKSSTGGFLPPRVTLESLDSHDPIVNPQDPEGQLPRGTIVHHEGGSIPPGLYLWHGGTGGGWGKIVTEAPPEFFDNEAVGAIQVSGSVTATQFKISALNTAPASASASGTLGEIRITSDYIYICVAPNTWKRAPLLGSW